jgi:hypothetical protein
MKPTAWVFSGLMLLGYILALTIFYNRLPQQWSIDSAYLQDLMTQGTLLESDAFTATANILASIPPTLLQIAIVLLGFALILLFAGTSFTIGAGAASIILLMPVLLMGLLRPQKEILVVALSLTVLASVYRSKSTRLPLLVTSITYVTYGAYVRPYYLLILALFAVLYSLPRWPKWLMVITAATAFCGLWFLPVEIFQNLQGVRDNNNFERIAGELGNRTFFFNPFSTSSVGGFLLNYLYAAVRLNLPLLFSFKPQEAFLTATSIVYALLLISQFKWSNWRARFLAALFSAHLAVLWLFEPDLGSYLRHASSVVAYLWPGLILWQARGVKLPQHLIEKFYGASATASSPKHAR